MSDPGTGMRQANAYNAPAWAFQIKPLENELLSGYLCRVARAHGASPYGFCELQLQDKVFWARDFDRGVINRHDSVITAKSGMSAKRLEELTLRSWINRLTPKTYRHVERPSIIPWVNAAGVFHRNRRQHALQFCQECLADTQTTYKTWRLSFVVICPIHRSVLMDACPACDAPFVPHRAPGRINLCHVCQANLIRRIGFESRSTEKDSLVLRLQESLISRLEACNNTTHAAQALAEMNGMREVISSLFNRQNASRSAEALDIFGGAKCFGGPRFELSRHRRRYEVIAASAVLLEQWPESFQSVAQKLGLSQRGFSRDLSTRPDWINREIQKLPRGGSKSKLPRVSPKLTKVDRLAEERPNNWRAKRAALLLRAARKPS